MNITDLITITELSRLTFKSRPTIYKYLSDYSMDNLDEIPYSFIVLFGMVKDGEATRARIIEYCKTNFVSPTIKNDKELAEIMELISANRDKLDLVQIKKQIEEMINK